MFTKPLEKRAGSPSQPPAASIAPELAAVQARDLLKALPNMARALPQSVWQSIPKEELVLHQIPEYGPNMGHRPTATQGYRTEIAGFKIEIFSALHRDTYTHRVGTPEGLGGESIVRTAQQFAEAEVSISKEMKGRPVRVSASGDSVVQIMQSIEQQSPASGGWSRLTSMFRR